MNEDLRSLNEELNTINDQLRAKVAELEERTAELDNLLNSTEVATLFLDRALCIRRFTPAMRDLLELGPSDLGRPLAHFAQRFSGSDLIGDAQRVIDRLVPSAVEVQGDDGRWYIRRMAPYRSADDRIDGVVVTFTEITERKRWEWELEGAKKFAEKIVDTIRVPLLVLTADFRVQTANQGFYDTFQVPRGETEGRLIYELGNRQWDILALRRLLEEVLPDNDQFEDFEVEHEFETIGRRTMLLNGRRLDHVQLILLAIEDVTERRLGGQALRESEARFRQFAEHSSDVLWIVDLEAGRLEYLSPAYERVWGEPRDAVMADLGRWRELVQPEDRERASEGLPRIAKGEAVVAEYRVVRPRDGEIRWIRDSGFPIPDEAGQVRRAGGLARDITVRRRVEDEKELLTRELSHRVKNVLAVVQSLARHTTAESEVDYQRVFIGRLQALARAHNLLLEAQWRGTDLRTLVDDAVAAYNVDHPQVIAVAGEPVPVGARKALGLCLVLHELGTNAAKYGALSRHEGRLRVSWRVEAGDPDRRIRLKWQERQGPPVVPPTSSGFGMRLIEQACTQELDGTVDLDYAPEGFVCELSFPLDEAD